jgi:hypothetical protein
MNRRAFLGTLAGGLVAAPLAAGAQQPQRLSRRSLPGRVGHLSGSGRRHLMCAPSCGAGVSPTSRRTTPERPDRRFLHPARGE